MTFQNPFTIRRHCSDKDRRGATTKQQRKASSSPVRAVFVLCLACSGSSSSLGHIPFLHHPSSKEPCFPCHPITTPSLLVSALSRPSFLHNKKSPSNNKPQSRTLLRSSWTSITWNRSPPGTRAKPVSNDCCGLRNKRQQRRQRPQRPTPTPILLRPPMLRQRRGRIWPTIFVKWATCIGPEIWWPC